MPSPPLDPSSLQSFREEAFLFAVFLIAPPEHSSLKHSKLLLLPSWKHGFWHNAVPFELYILPRVVLFPPVRHFFVPGIYSFLSFDLPFPLTFIKAHWVRVKGNYQVKEGIYLVNFRVSCQVTQKEVFGFTW